MGRACDRGTASACTLHELAMRQKLVERGDGLGFGGENRQALFPEFGRDARLWHRRHQRFARGTGKIRRIAGEGIHVVTLPRHRDADQERVCSRIMCQRGEDVREQPAVGQQRRGNVDRIGRGGEARQDFREIRARLVGKFCHWHADRGGGVRHHHAHRARVADRHQAASRGLPAFQIQLDGADQFRCIAGAPDAVLRQKGVHHAILVGERAGVRACRFLSCRCAAALQRNHRQVALAGNARSLGEMLRVADALEIKQQQLQFRVFRHHRRKFGNRDIAVVTGGMRMAHAHAAFAQQAVGHHAHCSRLADDAYRPVLGRHLDVHGRKRQDRAAAEVSQPLAIRPDNAHAAGACDFTHVPFLGLAGARVGLAETGRHDDRDSYTQLRALLYRLHRGIARYHDDRDFRCLGQIHQRRIGFVALRLGSLWIDRIDPALEPEAGQVQQRAPSQLVRVFRGANDGDGLRIQHCAQRCASGIAHLPVLSK